MDRFASPASQSRLATVIAYMRGNPGATRADVADLLGVCEQTARRYHAEARRRLQEADKQPRPDLFTIPKFKDLK